MGLGKGGKRGNGREGSQGGRGDRRRGGKQMEGEEGTLREVEFPKCGNFDH